MKIILIGSPGTGKGTQGDFIAKKYQIPKISAGDILRQSINKNHVMEKKIQDCIKHGKLVSNKIICQLVKKRIQEKDCIHGFLLDGFPRTIQQAIYLSLEKINIDYILEFFISSKIILERISGRRIHQKSGRTYHIQFNPPKEKNKDDITGEDLIIREDDKIEIIQKRLIEYKKNALLLQEYYCKNHSIKYLKINAKRSILETKQIIESLLI